MSARTVTVCANCLQASCWQGEFYCQEAKWSKTVEKTVPQLEAMAREHSKYWEEGAGVDFRAGRNPNKDGD